MRGRTSEAGGVDNGGMDDWANRWEHEQISRKISPGGMDSRCMDRRVGTGQWVSDQTSTGAGVTDEWTNRQMDGQMYPVMVGWVERLIYKWNDGE